MSLPFTRQQFLLVFEQYNRAVWPGQIVLYLLALWVIVSVLIGMKNPGKLIGAILGALWCWMGAVYHWGFFAAINKAAILFGLLFLLQGVLFIIAGPLQNRLSFRPGLDSSGVAGAFLLLYSLLLYPLLGAWLGHAYPQGPIFGVPCPTTIFTFGILLWTSGRIPVFILVIPAVWSLIGSAAVLQLGIYEDAGLLLSGIIGIFLILARNRAAGDGKQKA